MRLVSLVLATLVSFAAPPLDAARVTAFDAAQTAPRVSAVKVDGADIHWTSRGTGAQTVIFVHGWTCDESSWREQVPAISQRYRVITLDLPGHGQSGMPASGMFSMELFARAVEGVRVAAGVDKVVLVGHSMGTPVIRKYALMYPTRVAGMVLVDGLVQIADAAGTGRGGAPPAIRTMTGPARENMVRGMFSSITSPELQQHILKMMMSAPEATASGAMAATQDRSQWSNEPIKVPVLAVYAGARPLGSESGVKTLYPMAEYHQIPDTGHFLMMEKPAEFNRLLTGFLARIRA
jgi:sigma-B regulation protein RsbQ